MGEIRTRFCFIFYTGPYNSTSSISDSFKMPEKPHRQADPPVTCWVAARHQTRCAALVDEMITCRLDMTSVWLGEATPRHARRSAHVATAPPYCRRRSVEVLSRRQNALRNFRCGRYCDRGTEGGPTARRALFNRGTLRYLMELDRDILSALTDRQSRASDGR
jgi:hypothetical protein